MDEIAEQVRIVRMNIRLVARQNFLWRVRIVIVGFVIVACQAKEVTSYTGIASSTSGIPNTPILLPEDHPTSKYSLPAVSATASQALASVSTREATISLPTTSTPAAAFQTGVQITTPQEAIVVIQTHFAEVAGIDPILTPRPFGSDLVVVFERVDRWEIVFSHGVGDCAVGCLSNYYWYYTVWPDGQIAKAGEFSRVFDGRNNRYVEVGLPLWGFPR